MANAESEGEDTPEATEFRECFECGHESPERIGLVREIEGEEQWFCIVCGDKIDEQEGRK